MKFFKVKNNNIKLRLMTLNDTDNIIKWRNNPRVYNNFIYQGNLTEEIHLQWIKNVIETKKAVQFIIVINDGGVSYDIGSVYFRDINYEHKKAEYGIFIGDDRFVGQGYGTIACRLACQYAFEVMNLHKIFLRVFATNHQAIKSYEKVGFIKEGLFRDDVYIQGKFIDVIFMGLINSN